MRKIMPLVVLALLGCDGFPILGPVFNGSAEEEPKGTIRIVLPCHDELGNTFPCPAPATPPPERRGR